MENFYIAQQQNKNQSENYPVKITLLVFILVLNVLKMNGQATLPAISSFPYAFTTYSGASFPASLTIGRETGTTLTTADIPNDAINGSGAGAWQAEGANGISFRGNNGTSSNQRGCFQIRVNSTGQSSVKVNWTASTITDDFWNSSKLDLQWRNGSSGAWNNVSGFTYTSGSTSSFNATLPAGANNLADLRIRWVYYDNSYVNFLSNTRDRVAIDDIFICVQPSISASNNGPVCGGATLNLIATGSSGTFAWSGPSSYTSSVQNPTRSNATGAMSGTYTVTVTNAGCSNSATTNVTVNDPAALASSNSPICSGNTINLSTTNVSGATYQWSGPNSFSSTSRTPSITNATVVNGGNYTVTVTIAGCVATSSTNVVVNTTPSISAGSNTPVCAGSSLNLTATGSSGVFSWSGPNSFTSTAQNPSISNVSIAATGTYTVTVNNSGCTATSSTSVAVNNAPTGIPTSSPTVVCAGANVNLTANMFLDNSYTASPNTVITDNNATGINSTVSVPAQVIANASRLKISITVGTGHTYIGDVIAKLTSPCGNTTIFDRLGVPASTYGNDQDFTGTYVFDINAGSILPETNSGPTIIPPASYKPSTTSGAANANWSGITFPCNAAGNWVLNMSDRVAGDVGTLVSWSVIISSNSGVTYSWTSNPAGFTSSSENTSANPVVPTIYTVAATGAGCTNNQSVSVSVNAVPDPLVSSNAPICVGNDINFTADNQAAGQSSGNTYSWKRPNNTVFSTQQSPTISNATAANNGNYTVIITNQFLCTASAIVPILVNPNPTLNIVSIQNESCPGANDGALTVNATNGSPAYTYTYDFVNFNGNGVFADLAPGSITAYVSDANGCLGNASATITSPNLPAAITCGGSLNVNTDAGLCSATISNAQLLAQLSLVTGTPTPIVTFSPAAGSFAVGTTVVTATASNSCGVAVCTFDVIVTDAELPTISCLPDGNVNTDIGSCTASSAGTPLTNDNCGIASVIPDIAGPYSIGNHTIIWTVTDVHGNTNTCTQNIVVVDSENPMISNCPGNITINNDQGTCGAVVNYTAPTASDNCSGASIIGNHNSGETFPIGTTTVTYTATDASGNVSTCSFMVTVNGINPIAPTSVSSNADFNNICVGSSIQLTANGGSLGSMNGQYKWYNTTCGGVLAGTGSTITVSPTTNTTYFVRIEDGCGNITTCVAVPVTVSTSPVTASVTVPFVGMPSNICSGTVVSLSIPPVNKATQYIWDAPAGAYFNGNPINVSPFSTTTPNVSITYGNPSGSLYSTGVQASNACGSSARKVQKTRGIISVPTNISGSSTACENSSISYSTPEVDAASSYVWSVTGDATVSGTTSMVTVNFGPAWNGGTLCVAAQTSCYASPTKCLTISKSAAPLTNLSGNFTACPNANQTYSVNASAGAASYTWTLPSGVFGSSSTNSINAHFNSSYNSTGNICVSVTSICGVTSAPKCKTVAPGLPSMPSSVSGPLNGLCGQTVVYQCPTQSGTTFNWSVPSGAIINNGQGTNAVSVTYSTLSTSPLCVTASNSCGSSNARCVTAKGAPNSPSSLTATPGSWCANTQGIEFSANLANSTGSYTLNWLYPSAPVANYVFGGGNSSSLILDWGSGNGNVVVVASNACGSGSKAFNVNISCREGEAAVTQNMFSMYPNPASTLVNVQFSSTDNSTYRLQLTDLSGRLIMDKTVTAQAGLNTHQIDLKQMAKGVYMLLLKSNDNTQKQKIVIE